MDLEREIREMKKIALLYSKRGRLELSLEILKTVADMECRSYGERSRPVALTIYQIAETRCNLSQFKEARENFEQAVNIWQELHPADLESVLGYSNALTRMQTEAAKEEAKDFYDSDESAA